jgi:hypothetical protein
LSPTQHPVTSQWGPEHCLLPNQWQEQGQQQQPHQQEEGRQVHPNLLQLQELHPNKHECFSSMLRYFKKKAS